MSVADVERTMVAVSPMSAWQDTRVYLPAGASARISASGTWRGWPSASLWPGPEGNEAWKGRVAFVPASALIGRLGTDGKPFYVGPKSEITAKQNGRPYLASLRPDILCRCVKFSCGKFGLRKELLAGPIKLLDSDREWSIGRFRAAVEQLR